MPEIIPLYDRLVVKKVEVEEVTEGGIVLPSSVRENEKEVRAKVVAVGEGYPLEDGGTRPLAVSVGDIVVLEQFSGTDFKFGDEKFILVREENVLGILKG